MGITSMYNAFIFQTKLKEIPAGIFDGLTEVTTFASTFVGCTALTSIPVGLFDNNTKVTEFVMTFRDCTALAGESPYTIINVDGNDVKVHLYERANYPEHFIAPEYFGSCFGECTGLSDWDEITAAGWN